MRAPAKLVVLLWQLSQAAVVTMWVADLPRAVVPLWQEAQPAGDAGVIHAGAGEAGRALVAALAGRGRDDVGRRLAARRGAVVAGGAAGGNAGVIHPAAGKARRATVAGFAGCRRNDVAARLAPCAHAIVAGAAARRDVDVLPIRGTETERVPVAAFACRRCRHVRWRLAAGVGAVVASDAGADRLAVVVANLTPRRLHMAPLAGIGRAGMRRRLARGNRTVVTGGALPRRPFEAAADVTGRAIDAGMRPRKRKSG